MPSEMDLIGGEEDEKETTPCRGLKYPYNVCAFVFVFSKCVSCYFLRMRTRVQFGLCVVLHGPSR